MQVAISLKYALIITAIITVVGLCVTLMESRAPLSAYDLVAGAFISPGLYPIHTILTLGLVGVIFDYYIHRPGVYTPGQ